MLKYYRKVNHGGVGAVQLAKVADWLGLPLGVLRPVSASVLQRHTHIYIYIVLVGTVSVWLCFVPRDCVGREHKTLKP